jgi:phosphoribosylanthranilate isomerase
MIPKIKICGITTAPPLNAACESGADFIGFVFVQSSPRYIAPRAASELSRLTPTGVKNVGLFVNPTDSDLDDALSQTMLDMIQLHGDEDPSRVIEIKNRTHMPIIKAIGIHDEKDMQKAYSYEDVVDYLLFDYKNPITNHQLPAAPYGGTGKSFDWSLLKDKNFSKPWMLSGGLNKNNIKEAIRILSPQAVDISSGVEIKKGIKDIEMIKEFVSIIKNI